MAGPAAVDPLCAIDWSTNTTVWPCGYVTTSCSGCCSAASLLAFCSPCTTRCVMMSLVRRTVAARPAARSLALDYSLQIIDTLSSLVAAVAGVRALTWLTIPLLTMRNRSQSERDDGKSDEPLRISARRCQGCHLHGRSTSRDLRGRGRWRSSSGRLQTRCCLGACRHGWSADWIDGTHFALTGQQ